ncbi:MAG: hypothetical protein HYX97_00530 [Chloroflexi bacterium]|nr:hypothetical protein [Chloroflexota bacterium]
MFRPTHIKETPLQPVPSRIKTILMVQPRTTHRGGINFELVSILRLGLPILAGSLRDYQSPTGAIYEPVIWLEDRSGPLDFEFVELLRPQAICITGLVNEIPRAYELSRQLREILPHCPQLGGGPHMSAVPGEALHFGAFDVIGHSQGTRYIGPLLDVMMSLRGQDRLSALKKIQGLSFVEDGRLASTSLPIMSDALPEGPTPLPNYDAIYGLSRESPLPALSIQLSDSCPYRCTFCRVWTHNGKFVQFKAGTQEDRLRQARDLQDRGLVYRDRAGKTAMFIVDDLAAWGLPIEANQPPGMTMDRFRELRQTRMDVYRSWKDLDFLDTFYTIAQVRAAHGDDAEMMEAMSVGARTRACYVGIESTDDMILKAMNKQQRMSDIERQVGNMTQAGITVVGMGIIGLPPDTHDRVIAQARWFRQNTRFSTVNYITPLWGTADAKYTQFRLLSEDGRIIPMIGYDGKVIDVDQSGEALAKVKVLRPSELPPYHRFTGRWACFKDTNEERNWAPEFTNKLVEEYYSIVRPVDTLYRRAAIQAKLVKWVDDRLVPISQLNEQRHRAAQALGEMASTALSDSRARLARIIEQAKQSLNTPLPKLQKP